MKSTDFGLVAAMPEETGPLLRRVREYRLEESGGYRLYRFVHGTKTVCLVESGIGPAHAAVATRLLIDAAAPKTIINFGFAGALSSGLRVGDLVLADRLLFLHERLFSEQQGLDHDKTGQCSELLMEQSPAMAAFITTAKTSTKKELASRLPAGIDQAVVEMESSAIARIASRENIPLIAIRAISDALDEELGFTLEEFCDKELNLKTWRVILTLMRKPWIAPQLLRLSGNAHHAGQNLSRALLRMITSITP